VWREIIILISVFVRQVLHDRPEPPGLGVPVQRGQDAGAHLASVVRGHGATPAVPECRGGARRTDSAVRGVRREMAVPRGPTDLHRWPGSRPVRVAVHYHITDPPEDIVLSHSTPQTPGPTVQGDQLQTR